MDNMPLDLDISELLPMDIHEWDNLRNTPLPYCFFVTILVDIQNSIQKKNLLKFTNRSIMIMD